MHYLPKELTYAWYVVLRQNSWENTLVGKIVALARARGLLCAVVNALTVPPDAPIELMAKVFERVGGGGEDVGKFVGHQAAMASLGPIGAIGARNENLPVTRHLH